MRRIFASRIKSRSGVWHSKFPIIVGEHDLTLHLVSGKHTGAEVIRFFGAMDATCATCWLIYYDPTLELQISIADTPPLKHAIDYKRRELFGDKPKRYAIVCGNKTSEEFFFGFWRRYFPSQTDELRCFRSLDEAYDWLGLSDTGRVAVARAIDDPGSTVKRRGAIGGARQAKLKLRETLHRRS
jgi:predicted Fe-S protein YdhL (DUF1289 family)